jgi:hypothetical protein
MITGTTQITRSSVSYANNTLTAKNGQENRRPLLHRVFGTK